MKKRLRPLVNLSTVISLLIAPSSILAVDFATKMLSNTTPARSWEDVASGTTYTSYGSGTYKFARTNNFAPWVEIKGPSAGVSCSGFSFDLGFIGIMNTDEIGDQLGQAGEAFMWGLLTVFKLATPNLSKVFEFINGMIRQIQDLLRNACAMGAKMAQAGAAMTGNPDGFKLMGPIDKAVDLLPVEEMQKLNNKSFLDKYDAAMDKIIESETAENANAIINSFLESSVDRLVKSLGGGGLKFLDVKIKQEAKRFTGKKPLLTHKKLSELFDDGKLKVGEEEVTWAFSSDERILNKAKYLLVSQLLGQVVLKDDISAENKALFHVNEADWKDTLRGLAEKKAGGKPSNISQEMTEQVFTIIPPREINSAEEVVKFLLEGNSDEKIKTDNRYLSVLVFPSSSYGPSIVERKAKFTQYLEETFDNSQIEMEFKGFEDGSRQGIAYLIDKNLPPEKHINDIGSYVNGPKATISSATVPVLADGIGKYCRILGQTTRRFGTTQAILQYKANLIKLNAILAAKDVLEATISTIGETENIDGVKDIKDVRLRIIHDALDILHEKEMAIIGSYVQWDEHFNALDAANKNKLEKTKI